MRIGLYVDFDGNITWIGRYGVEIAKALKRKNILSELWMDRYLKKKPGILSSLDIHRLKYLLNAPLRAANRRVALPDSDDVLLPPPYLVFLVTGGFALGEFVNNGRLGIHSIRKILQKNGITLQDKPCGQMYLTFHGYANMRGLNPEQVSVFENGDLLIVSSE
jgi:hypothetical protein